MKCKYCGTDYRKNTADLSFLPEAIREKMLMIPNCTCLNGIMKKEQEEAEENLERERQFNRIKRYKDISVVDKKFINSTFGNADMADKHMKLAEKYAEKFIEKGSTDIGLLLFGNCGTGKTYASACIANHLMKHGKTVLALNLNGYLNKIRTEWAEAERDVLDKASTCDLLIIDDFGTENKTEWVLEKVFNLIDARYRSKKPLLITTNLNFDKDSSKCEITKHFSIDGKDRIKDRLKEICYPVQVVGESRREISADKFRDFLR